MNIIPLSTAHIILTRYPADFVSPGTAFVLLHGYFLIKLVLFVNHTWRSGYHSQASHVFILIGSWYYQRHTTR